MHTATIETAPECPRCGSPDVLSEVYYPMFERARTTLICRVCDFFWQLASPEPEDGAPPRG